LRLGFDATTFLLGDDLLAQVHHRRRHEIERWCVGLAAHGEVAVVVDRRLLRGAIALRPDVLVPYKMDGGRVDFGVL
jgi:hypothetical protein